MNILLAVWRWLNDEFLLILHRSSPLRPSMSAANRGLTPASRRKRARDEDEVPSSIPASSRNALLLFQPSTMLTKNSSAFIPTGPATR